MLYHTFFRKETPLLVSGAVCSHRQETMRFLVPLLFLMIHHSIRAPLAAAADTLDANQTLIDGQTLVSSGQIFELGFFSIAASTSGNRYLGIWYKNLTPTYIWVANRNNPVNNSSSVEQASLLLTLNGSISLQKGSVSLWSAVPAKAVNGAFLQLLDNGNLVLIDNSSSSGEEYLWQSFDYITDTLLPGMKLGWNVETGLARNMTSWSSSSDPSSGDYSFSLDPPETPQLILRKGTQKMYRWGPWDGKRFSGSRELRPNPVFEPLFNSSFQDVYYSYKVVGASLLARFVVTTDGLIQYLSWRNDTQQWVTMITLQRDECDEYQRCGPYGSCYGGNVICKCLNGFDPSSPVNWNSLDWTGGCTRKWALNCGNGTATDGFVKYNNLKLPDNSRLASNKSSSLEECKTICSGNCSCTAYTRIDIHGNGGDCVLWFGDLIDIKNYPDGGDVLYVRMAREELDAIADAKRRRFVRLTLAITLPLICGILCLGFASWYIVRQRRATRRGKRLSYRGHTDSSEQDLELPLFDLLTVRTATEEFSSNNKIGQGGFGPVYLGVLPLGQEIAVKRLSLNSGQGVDEFKNEVKLIAQLQHRNLVKLLGCCIHEEERMLIYEYMPNKSLDYHLFDPARAKLLSWKKRFDIIMGIARGLLYLHQDSRLRIIHRDLKPSNILLDSGMSPKISDFGIARTFQGEQTGEMTKRVFGTFGYIAPEYALRGHISVKSDVFSFGVVVLEILSGKRIMGFSHPEYDLNLLGYTWKLWNEGNPLGLLDDKIGDFPGEEVVRCIQVGMLCCQLRPEDRPMMHSVVVMLGNDNMEIPEPKEAGFKAECMFKGSDTSSSAKDSSGTHNDISITTLQGR